MPKNLGIIILEIPNRHTNIFHLIFIAFYYFIIPLRIFLSRHSNHLSRYVHIWHDEIISMIFRQEGINGDSHLTSIDKVCLKNQLKNIPSNNTFHINITQITLELSFDHLFATYSNSSFCQVSKFLMNI